MVIAGKQEGLGRSALALGGRGSDLAVAVDCYRTVDALSSPGMPIGHITEINRIPLVSFVVHEHDEPYRPPIYIKEHRSLSRIARLDGVCTPFFFGKKDSHSRVTFRFGSVWCFVDDNPALVNLNDLLWDLDAEFEFAADDQLRAYTRSISQDRPRFLIQ